MSIEATPVHDDEEWNELLSRSRHSTPFHRYEALTVMANHSEATLHPFVGYKGDEPIGLFPVFTMRKGPLRTAFSPPPDLEISYLGPVQLGGGSPKQRKAERRHRGFIEAVLAAIDEGVDPQYTHVRTATSYDDPRPFIWNDFTPTPRYTYVVDIDTDEEDLFMSFSSDIRRNVRTAQEDFEYTLTMGDVGDVEQIISRVRQRHAEQDISYTVTEAFARDLYRSMPDQSVRAYVCHHDGEFVGGKLTLEDDETVYSWQTVSDLDSNVPIADLLDWWMIRTARQRGITHVDLVGANNPRLCSYKSKFNPEVATHYSLEDSTKTTTILKTIYKHLR